ncbi:hypothetical protein GJ699_03430 [Duganella sp. FT80W]|uniref:Secreted protein n=1 Tax=Duganella guangzhouensis TaxID=2666084 RepID=A0A6I2KTA1_9BURK|nr:hypothetical protein [Duganella guangzhouensis]MRW89028.1 hypothetical protein [Duganella guangzhouensis]
MKLLLLLLALTSLSANAYAGPSDFVIASDEFLSTELPKMEAAVATKDRAYFASGIERVKTFLNGHWADLDKFPSCTEAVSDFLIVGQCRISPPGSLCEPETFFPKFEANLAKCRAAAKANQASQRMLSTQPN